MKAPVVSVRALVGARRIRFSFGETSNPLLTSVSLPGSLRLPGLSASAPDGKQPTSQFAACLPLQLVVSYIIGLRHMPPTPYDPRSGILENTRRRPEWILENSLFGQIRVDRCRWQRRVGGSEERKGRGGGTERTGWRSGGAEMEEAEVRQRISYYFPNAGCRSRRICFDMSRICVVQDLQRMNSCRRLPVTSVSCRGIFPPYSS